MSSWLDAINLFSCRITRLSVKSTRSLENIVTKSFEACRRLETRLCSLDDSLYILIKKMTIDVYDEFVFVQFEIEKVNFVEVLFFSEDFFWKTRTSKNERRRLLLILLLILKKSHRDRNDISNLYALCCWKHEIWSCFETASICWEERWVLFRRFCKILRKEFWHVEKFDW
jgi:hypothetical protein